MARQSQRKTTNGRKRVTFSYENRDACEVVLMGDFNSWSPYKHLMKNDGDGVWRKTVVVPRGRYEYKFLVDGHWHNDPENGQTVPNFFGTQNNLIRV
jgi:1,4-alpha-glucan branching enzyme